MTSDQPAAASIGSTLAGSLWANGPGAPGGGTGRMFVKGEFLGTVIGIPDSRTGIVMLPPAAGGHPAGARELRPTGPRAWFAGRPANELGLRNVAFEVSALRGQCPVRALAAHLPGSVTDR